MANIIDPDVQQRVNETYIHILEADRATGIAMQQAHEARQAWRKLMDDLGNAPFMQPHESIGQERCEDIQYGAKQAAEMRARLKDRR